MDDVGDHPAGAGDDGGVGEDLAQPGRDFGGVHAEAAHQTYVLGAPEELGGAVGVAACQLSRGERGHHARGHGTAFGVHEGGVPLVLGHEVEFVDRRGRIGGGRGEQPDEAVAERGHRRPVEQVGGVFDLADDSGGLAVRSVPLLQTDVHVELGGVADHVLEPGFEAGDGQLDLVEVLEGQHDLVERVPCERPHRVDHLDEALERHVLVGERGQVGLADALQQFGERGTARLGAQHERVDESGMPTPTTLLAVVAAETRSSAWWVTCTVVSVMPYMLTSTGESSGCRSYQDDSRPRSSASPPKTTYLSDSSVPGFSSSACMSW
ncbi:hypothetical protein SCALM49S_06695 [Streptomyces californicus]